MALYKSAKGKVIDMARLAAQNELAIAVSNVRINARGDELGPGGQIIRKQSDVAHVPSTGTPVEHYVAPAPVQVKESIKETAKPQPALVSPAPVAFELPVESTVNESKPNNNKGK